MTSYPTHPPTSIEIEEDADVSYLLNGGPLHGAVLCLAADLQRDEMQVRIEIGGTVHTYIGATLGDALKHVADAAHLGHAWRPVRWIEANGQMHIFSDDRPVMPVEVSR